MTFKHLTAVVALPALLAIGTTAAHAQAAVGIGTTKAGAVFQISTGVATLASKAGVTMRTQPMAGTQQYLPAINTGRLEFGIVNGPQLGWAMTGTGLSQGRPNADLRLVATLMRFNTGTIVASDSNIKTTADLKGKKLPHGYTGSPLFQKFTEAALANGGLTFDDVSKVPVTSLQQGWDTLAERKIDMSTAAVGTGYLDLVAQKLGGIRFIQWDDSAAAVKRTLAVMPGLTIIPVAPGTAKKLTGIEVPTKMMAYYMTIVAHKGVSDDVVYKVTKAIYDGQKELQAQSPLWRTFDLKNMSAEKAATYHPGAVKLMKEKGVWQQ